MEHVGTCPCPRSSEDYSSISKCWQASEAILLGLWMATFSLYPHMVCRP